MRIHILHCGMIQVSETVPYGDRIHIRDTGRQLFSSEQERVRLPVCVYLVEHPRGLLLVDTGWCREISPNGVYDAKAVHRVLSPALSAFYHPSLPSGMSAREQLAAMGIRPQDLSHILLTHLDPDHVAGLKELSGARHIILPEDEYFWSCRTVFKLRQPRSLWGDQPIERLFYRGSPLGPNRWAIDLFGDESVQLVNVPGHTDGQAAVILRSGGRFVLLAADAAFSPRNWQESTAPGFGLSHDWQMRSLRWIKEMADDPACAAVLCSHDPDVKPGILDF